MSKILNQRRSSRFPDVIYTIAIQDNGELICNCPACEHGRECYEKMKIRSQMEYEKQLAVKHAICEIKIPDKQILIKEQWDYITAQKIRWLREHPEDAILPQYEKLAHEIGIRHPLEHRAEMIPLLGPWKRTESLVKKEESKPSAWANYKTSRKEKRSS
jgi:hypothetical protein